MRESDIRPVEFMDEFLRLARKDAERIFSAPGTRLSRPCPGCGGSAAVPSFDKNGFEMVRCRDCDTLYANPAPHPEQLAEYYKDSPSQIYWATVFFPAVAEVRRGQIFRPRVLKIQDLLKAHGWAPGILIDIGTGSGMFLEEGLKGGLGTKVKAVEPNGILAQACRDKGFETFEGFAADAAVDSAWIGVADLVTSFEVIEHTLDPAAFMGDLAALAKPGGLILVTGLCGTGFDILTLGEKSDSVCPPHHITFLSRKGVTALLRRVGLEEVAFLTPGQLDVDIVANALETDSQAIDDPFLRSLFMDSEPDTLQAFQEFLAAHGLSSHMWLVARRPS